MKLSLGYLKPKPQRSIWHLRNKCLQEIKISKELNISGQTVHQTLQVANLKIGEALEETAKINKINIQIVDITNGFLLGFSSHFKTTAFVTCSAKNGIQVWYKHEGDCLKCSNLQSCRETLLEEAKDRNFLVLDETSSILPFKIAESLINKITGEA